MREVKVWGGIGEKKSNKGTQWYIQDRIYDSEGLSPALTTYKSDYLIIIRQRRCDFEHWNTLTDEERRNKCKP